MDRDIGIRQHIQAVRGSLKPTLQSVADEVLARPDAVRRMNIKELAEACGVSEASISRFVRGIGMQNYRDFILRMAEATAAETRGAETAEPQGIYENIGREDTAESVLSKIAHRQMDVARAGLSTIRPEALERGAQMVIEARSLLLLAAGSSSLAAESGVVRFGRIGKPAAFHRDRNNQVILAASLPPDALVIAISDTGRTRQTVEATEAARAAGAPAIAVTSYSDSPLARAADLVLVTPPAYEPSGEEPLYESMVAKFGQLLAVDALYSLAAVKDYERAVSHLRRGDPFIQTSRSTRRTHGSD